MIPRASQIFVAAACWYLGGCVASSDSRPPYCNSPECVPTRGSTLGGSSGGASSTGTGVVSVAGSGDALVTIQAQVVEVDEPAGFSVASGVLASGAFTVTAPTAAGSSFDTSVYSTFTLNNVLRSRTAWLTAKPAIVGVVLAGLVGFDATTTSTVVVPVVNSIGLQTVSGSLTNLTTIDATKAQVILRFFDPNLGRPVAGVTVAMAGVGRVAYDLGAGYTDDARGTSNRGLAFLFNVDASAVPAMRSLTLSGTVSGVGNVYIQAGTATVLELGVSTK